MRAHAVGRADNARHVLPLHHSSPPVRPSCGAPLHTSRPGVFQSARCGPWRRSLATSSSPATSLPLTPHELAVPRNEEALGRLVHQLVEQHQVQQAAKLVTDFQASCKRSLKPRILSKLLYGFRKVNDMSGARGVYAQLERAGAVQAEDYRAMIDLHCAAGEMDRAEECVAAMRHAQYPATRPVFNSLIAGYCKEGKLDKAEESLQRMLAAGTRPDGATYGALIGGYIRSVSDGSALEKAERARTLWAEMRASKIEPPAPAYHWLVHGLLVLGEPKHLAEAFLAFHEMLTRNRNLRPDAHLWNRAVACAAKMRPSELPQLIALARENGAALWDETMLGILRGALGHDQETTVAMLAQIGNVVAQGRSPILHNELVAAYARLGPSAFEHVAAQLREMVRVGVPASTQTLRSLLSAPHSDTMACNNLAKVLEEVFASPATSRRSLDDFPRLRALLDTAADAKSSQPETMALLWAVSAVANVDWDQPSLERAAVALLSSSATSGLGFRVLDEMRSRKLKISRDTYEALIEASTAARSPENAARLFAVLAARKEASLRAALALIKAGAASVDGVTRALEESSVELTPAGQNQLIAAFAEQLDSAAALELLDHAKLLSFQIPPSTYDALMRMHVRRGELSDALRLVREEKYRSRFKVEAPTAATANLILSALLNRQARDDALEFFGRMRTSGHPLQRRRTAVRLIIAAARAGRFPLALAWLAELLSAGPFGSQESATLARLCTGVLQYLCDRSQHQLAMQLLSLMKAHEATCGAELTESAARAVLSSLLARKKEALAIECYTGMRSIRLARSSPRLVGGIVLLAARTGRFELAAEWLSDLLSLTAADSANTYRRICSSLVWHMCNARSPRTALQVLDVMQKHGLPPTESMVKMVRSAVNPEPSLLRALNERHGTGQS